jgi:NH3-dependent NAD+ synthetase
MADVKLTAKQEAFAQGIADGLGQADAYRTAYDAEGMKDSTIYSKASVLMSDGKVRARVDDLQAQVAEKQLWSREMSVKALVQAYREGSGAVKVSAVKELNAMHGYNEPSKLNISGNMVTRIQRVVTDDNAED